MNKSNHTFNPILVSNGDYLQWYRDGRCYPPSAKRTTLNCSSYDDAVKRGEEAYEDRDELDHIVIVECDENGEYVTGE